jgi:riboflavin transporter FmnP
LTPGVFGQTATVVSFLLSVTFGCGVVIAVAHVLNQRFVAPVYDVAANLTAFGCAVAASVLLGHPIPAGLSGVAILCWLVLARRTAVDRHDRRSSRNVSDNE